MRSTRATRNASVRTGVLVTGGIRHTPPTHCPRTSDTNRAAHAKLASKTDFKDHLPFLAKTGVTACDSGIIRESALDRNGTRTETSPTLPGVVNAFHVPTHGLE